jgi:hypothetical protein
MTAASATGRANAAASVDVIDVGTIVLKAQQDAWNNIDIVRGQLQLPMNFLLILPACNLGLQDPPKTFTGSCSPNSCNLLHMY